MRKNLEEKGFKINHNKTCHDYPSYNGSYTRSLNTINNSLMNFSSEIVIDLHRDALGNNSNYGPCVQIGEERYFDNYNGSNRSYTRIHKVSIPVEVLDSAKEYEIHICGLCTDICVIANAILFLQSVLGKRIPYTALL